MKTPKKLSRIFLLLALFSLPLNAYASLEWQIKVFKESLNYFDQQYPGIIDEGSIIDQLNSIQTEDEKAAAHALNALRKQVFLKHPKIASGNILFVQIPTDVLKTQSGLLQNKIGLMETHLSLSSIPKDAPSGSIEQMSVREGNLSLSTLIEANENEPLYGIDLHWDGQRFLFSRRVNDYWEVFEATLGGKLTIRQVSNGGQFAIDSYDAAYLPNGKIVFGSNAPIQGVPCWHGHPNMVANLYLMDSNGENIRQITYDQGHNAQPYVLQDGRIIFHRWDYTGMNRVFNQFLMQMRPDGTDQRVLYGTNTWWPNGTFAHRQLPDSEKVLGIAGGYHDTARSGYLAIIDPNKGDRGTEPLTTIVTGTQRPPQQPVADYWIREVFPKFTDPYPIDEDYYLASVARDPDNFPDYELCLVDRFGNITPLAAPKDHTILNPILVESRPTPHTLPEKVDLEQDMASVFIQDVYAGPGLSGVPRDVIKKVRVIAYNYGFPTLAGIDKIGMSGPWEVVEILGEANVYEDGSAHFKIPADTPVAFQMVDKYGQAVQLMRTWTTAMPGEQMSCIGCHENSTLAPLPKQSQALLFPPEDLTPWHGPARPFDFEVEVQPVLNQNCLSCHNGTQDLVDLRPRSLAPEYKGPIMSFYDRNRMHEDYLQYTDGERRADYSPAYETLIKYIRRVGVGDTVSLLTPGEYKANTTPLFQLLQKGHYDVQLTREDMERLSTWIDLNGPYHGSWLNVYDMPPADGHYERRYEFRQRYGSKQPRYDQSELSEVQLPENFEIQKTSGAFQNIEEQPTLEPIEFIQPTPKWVTKQVREIKIAEGVSLSFLKVNPGTFTMGSTEGSLDEVPLREVEIKEPFWMSQTEISNKVFQAFKAEHDSGYLQKRHDNRPDDKGLALNRPDQPVLRVSWEEAMAFCEWLSDKTGIPFTLPTEEQWEYACRSGKDTPYFYGNAANDFSAYANLADYSFARDGVTGRSRNSQFFSTAADVEMLNSHLVDLSDTRFRDAFIGTAPVAHFESNPWGMISMHGNVAEWTLSDYVPHPDSNYTPSDESLKVVRGGSFSDTPKRSTSSYRIGYPEWQKVYNVGFRIISNDTL